MDFPDSDPEKEPEAWLVYFEEHYPALGAALRCSPDPRAGVLATIAFSSAQCRVQFELLLCAMAGALASNSGSASSIRQDIRHLVDNDDFWQRITGALVGLRGPRGEA